MNGAFPILFTLGSAAGLAWLALGAASRTEGPAERGRETAAALAAVDSGLAALAGGLVGSRAAFVILYWGYYGSRLPEVLAFWEGGLSFAGGAAGALIGLAIYARVTGGSFWGLADALAVPAALLAFAGWLGCLLDGCAYGARAEAGWLTPPSPDLLGLKAQRWPTQSLGALLSLGAFALLLWARPRLRRGAAACLSLGLLAVSSLAVSALRADPTVMFRGARADSLGAAGLLLAAVIGLALRMARR